LRDADATDPRVDALAADMRAVARTVVARQAGQGGGGSAAAMSKLSAQDLQRWAAGIEAALHALPPAVRRAWELVLTDMFIAVSEGKGT
jgi:hypothetical protein